MTLFVYIRCLCADKSDEVMNKLMVETTNRAECTTKGLLAVENRIDTLQNEGVCLLEAVDKMKEAKAILSCYYISAADIDRNRAVSFAPQLPPSCLCQHARPPQASHSLSTIYLYLLMYLYML